MTNHLTQKARGSASIATSFIAFSAITAAAAITPFSAPLHAQEAPAIAATAAANHKLASAAPPMSAKDLIALPKMGDLAVSSDGKFALYRVSETDPDALDSTTKYWVQNLHKPETAPAQINLHGAAHDFTFGADGYLYFLSSRAAQDGRVGVTQLWRARWGRNSEIGSPQQVSHLNTQINGYRLSNDAKKIVIYGEINRECTQYDCGKSQGTIAEDAFAGKNIGSGRLYDGADGFVRHWDQWKTPGVYSRLFAFDLDNGRLVAGGGANGAKAGGTALDGPANAGGLTGDTPTKPFGGSEDIAWGADGAGVYFTARQAGAAEPSSTNVDIYYSDLSGNHPVNITEGNLATDTLPTPSPDGQYLAYVAMERAGYEADRLVIQLRNLATGKTRALTQDFDRSFSSLAWSKDSRWIFAGAQDVLDTPAYRIDPQNGEVQRLDLVEGNEARIGAITPLTGGGLLFTRSAINNPNELYLSRGNNGTFAQAQQLTHLSDPILNARAPITTRRFHFTGADGDKVWGQITKPAAHNTGESSGNHSGESSGLNTSPKRPLPAILYIHGGPQGSFNDGWSSRWNPRVLASQGFAVISVDFHGSTGYGQEFTDSIRMDWGGKPLEDLQKGLTAALASDPTIDGTRACAMGASYGGYMVNWIAGKWPDRFQCIVQHDGLFELRSFYHATEELWFPRWDFGGSYDENPVNYEKWNPANHADQWKTPMLVITGEKDFRVPYTQGIQSFTALQERKIPSQLLVFPKENHWVLAPQNSLQWHNVVFDWLDRWLKD